MPRRESIYEDEIKEKQSTDSASNVPNQDCADLHEIKHSMCASQFDESTPIRTMYRANQNPMATRVHCVFLLLETLSDSLP